MLAAAPNAQAKDTGAPVVFESDTLDYDSAREVVVANGHVSITQGAMVLLAERVEYDRASDEVTASGNVSLLEETGNVYFADSMRLKRQLRVGVVQHFKARLADGSLLVANAAERKSDTLTELWQAAYTPCRIICNNKGEASDPLWSVDAHQATFDEGAEKIRYRDAVVRAYGLPVFYTPYFSHSTPGAPNESGILLPQYSFNNNLGSTASLPYYYVIDQSQDATLTPIYTSKEGLVMQGEYRRQFNNGKMKVDGSITNPQNRDAAGNLIDGNQVRGYFGANGDFTINEHWDWGFGIRRATDDTYLRRYFNNTEAFLSSRVFLEGHDFAVNERSFASAEGLAFQGLQAADDNDKIPIIFPLLNLSLQGNKDSLGGRWGVDANAMSLTRNDGAGSRRLASLTRYNLPYLTDSGQLLTLGAQMRSDIYSVDDVALSDGRNYNGTTGRLVPEVNALWRMPFEKRFESSASWVLEPTVGVALSPGGGNPEKLPNEDSQIPEFTDANLFDFNRFSGWDRIESGPRATYGLRSQYLFPTGQNITFVAGQHARLEPNTLFPFSNDLDSRLSDYVGKVGFEVDPFDIAYRFRLDRKNLTPKRQEVDFTTRFSKISTTLSYLSLRDDPLLATKEEVSIGSSYQVTPQWSLSASARRDLLLDQMVDVNGAAIFKNECLMLIALIGRSYTSDRDVQPTTHFNLQLVLQNIGQTQ